MKKISIARFVMVILSVVLVSTVLTDVDIYAAEKIEQIEAVTYEFDKNSKYEITEAIINETSIAGTLELTGNYKTIGSKDGVVQVDVKEGQVSASYTVNKDFLGTDESKWHVIEDNAKQIDGMSIDEKIKSGAMIIQTSLDGEKWVTDSIRTDIFSNTSIFDEPIYITKDIQLVNGCFYKVIVCYEQEIVNGKSKKLFINVDNKSYRKCANVYMFYAVNSSEKSMSNHSSTPRKELGEREEMKKDTGFSERVTIGNSDPHYGWNLGTFSINGYTREVVGNDGNSMFLKNAGDKVTLWFKLSKDIENLDGSGKYVIEEDKNGYDQAFEIPKTNFKHGALIIRFTDFEGVKHNPIIYTDFLAANATTGADTQAVLFEEGDYEVALNYTIKDTKVLGKEYDYRIAFKFSIRNGNTMFFPFDLGTGAELRDKAVTENGFMIDMAKSRYLNIDVERSVLVENSTGHTMDVRFNRPAKDGDKYSDEGIYVVSVTNQYTNEHTTKTFYVGSNPYYYALSKSGMDISGLDDLISQGYTISEDGSLMAPVVQESILEDNIVDNANTIQEIQEDTVESKEESLSDEKDLVLDEKNDAKPEAQEVVENEPKINNTKLPVVPVCLAITFILVVGFMLAKNKANKTISVTVDVEEDTGDK